MDGRMDRLCPVLTVKLKQSVITEPTNHSVETLETKFEYFSLNLFMLSLP